MFFIGIITNQKNELYIREKLSHLLPEENILFIYDRNIANMKNIQFETIVLDAKVNNKVELRKIIANSKYLLLNTDIAMDMEVFNNLNLTVITYGFNNKATFTVSSLEEKTIIICLQRIIFNRFGRKIEPQEYEIEIDENIEKYTIIATKILRILYAKKE